MRLSVGTSGYSYKEWKGPFYPEKLPAKEMLAWYATQLPSVEINNTFYRLPKASVLEGWASQVPDGFRFSITASRRITHFKRLKDAGDETGYLLDVLAALGDRLGVVLFQLPPNLKADPERFDRFLELLPDGTRAAFEFRHESWIDGPILERLRARRFALVVSDTEEEPKDAVAATSAVAYLRLRRPGYARADLADWAQRLRAEPRDEAFVFFKHEDEGAGPKLAAEFLAVAERAEGRRGAAAKVARAKEAREAG